MEWALLCALALLLRPGPGLGGGEASTTAEDDEMCSRWLYGMEPPVVDDFECAEQYDGEDVKYCCGTCGQTSGCSLEEAAEDEEQRPTCGQEIWHSSPPVSNWVRLIWFCAGALVTVTFYWGVYYPCSRFWCKQRFFCERQQQILLEDDSPFRFSSIDHPHFCGAYRRTALPAFGGGVEDLQSICDRLPAFHNTPDVQLLPGHSEDDGAIILSPATLPLGSVPGCTLELNLGSETSLTKSRRHEILA
ncbi:uncharacterized protein LOC133371452 isoform X1 [Rhineura floridana]|uniref:uncharacterized protein LOC133371452 isoform X1 n=1 Tax=Rhineura floridana TaxID=261503 RepID=UPI002AC7EC23|nr:uncharacterized protein LOC133371452 isoform X1 [Rhineura floridana]